MSEIQLNRLSVVFGRGRASYTAVNDVTLEVPQGSTLGVVGESGSGKTTVARVIAGLQRATSGEVMVGGLPIKTLAGARRSGIQMVFQNPYASLNPRQKVGASLAELSPRSEALGQRWTPQQLLEMVRLSPSTAEKYPQELSGGMRQRVAVARAIAVKPTVLIADEVTSALDVSVQGAVINMLRDLQRDLGFTMVFISHNLAIVGYVADDIAVMYRGDLVEHSSTESLLANAAHPYTRLLLASVPRAGGLEYFSSQWDEWKALSN